LNYEATRYNAAEAMLEALQETGIKYLFSNLGSDHPAVIEGLAKAKALNRALPQVIICPHEFVALTAAHGYFLLGGEPQGVFVHTDVGTQNLGGSVHNAMRSRIPVLIFSGETPYTMEGELPGSRNSHINYLQNVYDQRGIVRAYVKWEYDIRTGKNVKQLIYRAMQLAKTDPQGPVYLTGAREVLEEEVIPSPDLSAKWRPVEKVPLSAFAVEKILTALVESSNPLIVTSFMGRNVKSVEQLTELCETLAIPVIESNPNQMNFPSDHPLHLGFQGGKLLADADVILVIDGDVPWVSTLNRPNDQCRVFCIDVDPIKEKIPLWHVPAEAFYQADSYQALMQMNQFVKQGLDLNEDVIKERFRRLEQLHQEQKAKLKENESCPGDGIITPEWLTVCIRNVVDEETVVMNETITNGAHVAHHLPRNKPGTMFVNGGSSLGWNLGAAFGAKLAKPDKMVVSLTGDGSYLFGIPSSVYWMSRRYDAPFLTVIYNNQGWSATKNNLLKLYPHGIAKRDDRYWVNFDQPADLSKIAEAAGGAYALSVSDPEKLPEALASSIDMVKSGRSAVVDVRLPQISQQKD
jgi:acetolactate synthase-1/2/3 large subunit